MTSVHPLPHGNGRPPGVTSAKGSITRVGTEMRSYYGRPVLQEPVWTWEIPTYFFTGGLGGASAVLALAARAARNEKLGKTATYVGAVADLASPALLISDLGRPERFLNMMRVVKVTSPMNVGSWVLLVSGGASTTAALLEAAGRLKPVKLAAELVSALSGPLLASYTGILLADTAIPVWHEGRKELPFLFAASAGASAGAASTFFLSPREAGPARRLAIAGVAAENALMLAMEKRLGMLGEPYREGTVGKLNVAAKAATAAGGALLALAGRRSRLAAMAGSALVLGGVVALRWSVFKAGFASARDPRYTVEPQRERLNARQQQV